MFGTHFSKQRGQDIGWVRNQAVTVSDQSRKLLTYDFCLFVDIWLPWCDENRRRYFGDENALFLAIIVTFLEVLILALHLLGHSRFFKNVHHQVELLDVVAEACCLELKHAELTLTVDELELWLADQSNFLEDGLVLLKLWQLLFL